MISNTIEMLIIVYSKTFLQKKVFIPLVKTLSSYMVLFSCLINVLFSLILMENFVVFSNVRSILKLMLCNRNLTKLDKLTLLSSDCRASALKLSKHLKKQQYMFLSSFFQLYLYRDFFALFSYL